jgi:hypothetical protein
MVTLRHLRDHIGGPWNWCEYVGEWLKYASEIRPVDNYHPRLDVIHIGMSLHRLTPWGFTPDD